MSGLAHVLEEAGIATVIVALFRLHARKMRPPRTLWVPYELGRPLGAPDAVALQLTTLRAALALFGSAASPGTITDLDAEQPDANDDLSWVNAAAGTDTASLHDEVTALAPLHQAVVSARGRTTTGLSRLDLPAAAQFLQALHDDPATASPVNGLVPAQVMRYACDDLKAMYVEVATSGAGQPSTRQLGDWLYESTHLGAMLRALREQSIRSEDAARRAVGTGGLVTSEWATSVA